MKSACARSVRPYEGNNCRVCLKLLTDRDDMVIATVPTKRLSRLSAKSKSKMKISWHLNEKANPFHATCWDGLTSTDLTSVERNLLVHIEETVEKYQALGNLAASVTALVDLLKQSNHTISFTGAGISVSSGIPTYRGAEGIDTMEHFAIDTREDNDSDDDGDVDYTKLEPTLTHRGLAELHRRNMMHYVVTQNCDDLHHKGGFPRHRMTELHGNVFVEFCEKCDKEYVRDYSVDVFSTDCHNEHWYRKCPRCKWNHYTGRICSSKGCKGKLRDTIVNFGDDLHDSVLGGLPRATAESAKADLCLCLGSSLTVTPANSLPQMAKHLVICNPQATDLDHLATVRIWASADTVFQLLADQLGFTIPPNSSSAEKGKRKAMSSSSSSSSPPPSSNVKSSSSEAKTARKQSEDDAAISTKVKGTQSSTQAEDIRASQPSEESKGTITNASRKRKASAVIDLTLAH